MATTNPKTKTKKKKEKERWGKPQRREMARMNQLYHETNGTQGYSYLEAELSNDYLQELHDTNPVFRRTSPRTFNSNYRHWANRFRENLSLSGGRQAYFRESELFFLLFYGCCCSLFLFVSLTSPFLFRIW